MYDVTNPANASLPSSMGGFKGEESMKNIASYNKAVQDQSARYQPKLTLKNADSLLGMNFESVTNICFHFESQNELI